MSPAEPKDRGLSRKTIIQAIFGGPRGRLRFTQDSPILPDVWIAYAENPQEPQDLLINPYRGERSGTLARELRNRVKLVRKSEKFRWVEEAADVSPRVAHVPGLIVADLYFNELLRVILPNTFWWNKRVPDLRRALQLDLKTWNEDDDRKIKLSRDPKLFPLGGDKERNPPTEDSAARNRKQEIDKLAEFIEEDLEPSNEERLKTPPPPDLLKLIEVVGLIVLTRDNRVREDGTVLTASGKPSKRRAKELVTAFNNLFIEWPIDSEHWPTRNTIWSITLNRQAEVGGNDSSRAMKADAARSLFKVSCADIRWAIIDSGIDSQHPAFTNWGHCDPRNLSQSRTPRQEMTTDDNRPSRVIRTYDFGDLRDLQDLDFLERLQDRLCPNNKSAQPSEGMKALADDKETLTERLDRIHGRILMAARREVGATAEEMRGLDDEEIAKWEEQAKKRAGKQVKLLRERLQTGLELDWGILEDFIEYLEPERPILPHGTQVASVLAADWRSSYPETTDGGNDQAADWPESDLLPGEYPLIPLSECVQQMAGVCPDIELLDFRVMSEPLFKEGRDRIQTYRTHDFEEISALQFIRHLNARADEPYIHGANVSLSIPHDVTRFACGRTPVCEECDRLVANGVVVAVAAGNSGYDLPDDDSTREPFYRMASITDPGNAEAVITVGATHRERPHQYGISYFSSRGPTGDGRAKPDLVAPGEKIDAASPFGRSRSVDGTSFAAPHVSGAAAMLMARHSELIGQPQRIKDILCKTATDLGRERYCQGAGMLDVLRALQSV